MKQRTLCEGIIQILIFNTQFPRKLGIKLVSSTFTETLEIFWGNYSEWMSNWWSLSLSLFSICPKLLFPLMKFLWMKNSKIASSHGRTRCDKKSKWAWQELADVIWPSVRFVSQHTNAWMVFESLKDKCDSMTM